MMHQALQRSEDSTPPLQPPVPPKVGMHLVAISYTSVLIPRESFSAFLLKLADSSPWHIVIILTLFKLQAASWHDNNSKASLASSGYAVCHVTRRSKSDSRSPFTE